MAQLIFHMTDRSRTIDIMGIVNLTDNSYFAQSRCLGPDGEPDMDRVLERAGRMIDEGEWRRLRPALRAIRDAFPQVQISVDTYWSSVVQKTFDLIGPFIVNDISAGEDDPAMLGTVGRLGLTYAAMHKRGTPKTMQSLCSYRDVTGEVLEYFWEFGRKAEEAGIKEWILDPGFGFAKTVEQNYRLLLSELERFSCLGRRILVGVSRKSMIYKLFDITPEESLPQTQVLHLAALERGADILRVHDVAEAARTVAVWSRLADTYSVAPRHSK